MSLRGSAARRQSGPRRVASRLLRGLLVVSLPGVLLIAPFRWLPPPTSAFIERARSERGASGIHYRWTPLSQISPHLALCVLTAEDQRFPEHRGFDLASIRAALREERARPRGASTLSQQLAKNLYLWPGRSLVRKGLEAYLTVFLELLWPKRRILEVYLNVAEFAPGTFGAGAASRRLFEKAPRALSLREAALLAAVLPSPSRLRAADPSAYLQRRASEIELEASRLRPRLEPLL